MSTSLGPRNTKGRTVSRCSWALKTSLVMCLCKFLRHTQAHFVQKNGSATCSGLACLSACAEAAAPQAPRLLEILEDSLAIRIPLAADYTDNFVTGEMSSLKAP